MGYYNWEKSNSRDLTKLVPVKVYSSTWEWKAITFHGNGPHLDHFWGLQVHQQEWGDLMATCLEPICFRMYLRWLDKCEEPWSLLTQGQKPQRVVPGVFPNLIIPFPPTRPEESETNTYGCLHSLCSWPLSILRVPDFLVLIWCPQSLSMVFIPGLCLFASCLKWTFLLDILIGFRYHYYLYLLSHGLLLAPHTLAIRQVQWQLLISSHSLITSACRHMNLSLCRHMKERLDNFKVTT